MNDEQSRGDSAPEGERDDALEASAAPPEESEAAPAADGPSADGEDVTAGGYHYTVVDDAAAETRTDDVAAEAPATKGRSPLLIAALAIVPVVVIGALAWLAYAALANDGGGGGSERAEKNVGNVINVFSQGQDGAVVNRYEGALPPGFPDDVPTYPGSDVVASVVQIAGGNANYLVVYDTSDDREAVSAWFAAALDEDPWQLDAGQSGESSTLQRFTRIDDADISALVLIAESDSDSLTSIVYSVEIASGGDAASGDESFSPGESKPLPAGFPDEVPVYPDGTVIGFAFQNQPGTDSFSITIVTQDTITDVIEFYEGAFGENGWTVETQDASQAPLVNAEGLTFSAEDDSVSGAMFAGEHPRDDSYTQIELQVAVTN